MESIIFSNCFNYIGMALFCSKNLTILQILTILHFSQYCCKWKQFFILFHYFPPKLVISQWVLSLNRIGTNICNIDNKRCIKATRVVAINIILSIFFLHHFGNGVTKNSDKNSRLIKINIGFSRVLCHEDILYFIRFYMESIKTAMTINVGKVLRYSFLPFVEKGEILFFPLHSRQKSR